MRIWQICIDTGGTFTDCMAVDPDGNEHHLKILSSGRLKGLIKEQLSGNRFMVDTSWKLPNDILSGYTFEITGHDDKLKVVEFDTKSSVLILEGAITHPIKPDTSFEVYSGEEVPIVASRLLTQTPLHIDLPEIDMRLGSTKGTNALLERKGSHVIFLVTKGFKDLLKIKDQRRPDLFALNIERSEPIYHQVIEVDERMDANGKVLRHLDVSALIHALPSGKDVSFAIALLNSYQNPAHEIQLAQFLNERGFTYVSASSQIATDNKILPRAETCVVNAYLQPIIHTYIEGIRQQLNKGVFRIMTSSGSLTNSDQFHPKDSLLSGPAGGIVGALSVARSSNVDTIVTFDMGGTSTDVSIQSHHISYENVTQVGDASIVSPSIAIDTIAAGGGSICSVRDGLLSIGPESAGARPGPACYGSGGPLTITDLNLLSGRLVADAFNIPINKGLSKKALQAIQDQLAHDTSDTDQLIESLLLIANEKMAEAIKKIAVRKSTLR